ncbi:MAG: hypothetical protein ACWGNV_12780 [Bacteroidales bacterium]
MIQRDKYIPGTVDDQIVLLTQYRQQILELIRKGPEGRGPEDAAYWLRKICETGCEVTFENETSKKILQDLLLSIKHQLTALQSLYADSSYYV